MRGHPCSPHDCDYTEPGVVHCRECGRTWRLIVPTGRDGEPVWRRYEWVVYPDIGVRRRSRETGA